MGVLGRVHLSSCASRAHNYSSAAFDSDCGTPHAHTGLPTKLLSDRNGTLCKRDYSDSSSRHRIGHFFLQGIRGESGRSLLANYTRRSLSLHHFPRRGPYHLLPDESDFHFFHSKTRALTLRRHPPARFDCVSFAANMRAAAAGCCQKFRKLPIADLPRIGSRR